MPHSESDALDDQAARGVAIILSVLAVMVFIALLVTAIYPWGSA